MTTTPYQVITVNDDKDFKNYLDQSGQKPFVAIFWGAPYDNTLGDQYIDLPRLIGFDTIILVVKVGKVPATVRSQKIVRTPMLKIFGNRVCEATMDNCSDLNKTVDFIREHQIHLNH